MPGTQRWRGIRVTEFEQRQLKAIREEIDKDSPPVIHCQTPRPNRIYPAISGLDPFLDHHLNRLLIIELLHRDRRDAKSELPISRIALRFILSEGLDDVIHYGKKCVGFEDDSRSGVTARFEDGSTTAGDVLIGADGASSYVRAQLLPDARRENS